MRSIAIPVADREECAAALDVAFELGRRLGADVVGYHMRPNREGTEQNRLDISAVWGEPWPARDGQDAAKRAAAARKLFETKAAAADYRVSKGHGKGSDLRALWREKLGTPDKLMPLIGPLNDLMVVSRPATKQSRRATLVMMSAVLDSGIPVLVLPPSGAALPGRHVALAWNRGQQEARAMHSTLPLLRRAERVSVITVGSATRHGPKPREVVEYLRCHGVTAVEVKGSGEEGRGLVASAKKVGADVLLSGAYTKGRLREMLFGGVTEHLLFATQFPVILEHS